MELILRQPLRHGLRTDLLSWQPSNAILITGFIAANEKSVVQADMLRTMT